MDYLWCEIDTDLSARDIERALLRLADVRTHYDDLTHPFLHLSVDACDDDSAWSEAGLESGPTLEVWTHPRAPWTVSGQIEALIAVWRALLALPLRGLAVRNKPQVSQSRLVGDRPAPQELVVMRVQSEEPCVHPSASHGPWPCLPRRPPRGCRPRCRAPGCSPRPPSCRTLPRRGPWPMGA